MPKKKSKRATQRPLHYSEVGFSSSRYSKDDDRRDRPDRERSDRERTRTDRDRERNRNRADRDRENKERRDRNRAERERTRQAADRDKDWRMSSNQPLPRGAGTLGGHATPTFGHPSGGPNAVGYPSNISGPPLSPNRMQPVQNSSVMTSSINQRPSFPYNAAPPVRNTDRRVMGLGLGPIPGAGMGGLGLGRQQAPGGYPGNSDHYPQILDPSEFPSLTTRNLVQGDSYHQSLPAKPYGMVKQPVSESSAFTMSSEDFPALPGTIPAGAVGGSEVSGKITPSNSQTMESTEPRINNQLGESPSKRGIVTSPDGKVTNIPASMVNDQFGMVGLLTFIRVAETDPNLVSLALGFDLTALGLNLNATDSLYPSFGGPWGEGPVRAEDIEFTVPQEYNISDQHRHGHEFISSIREKLAPLKMNRYKEELLFYLFYTYTGDVLQVLAAAELYNRDWRYHKEEKIWITRAPGVNAIEKGGNFERGMYYFFDPISWRKVPKEFYLEYDKLEDRPNVPNHFLHAYLAQ